MSLIYAYGFARPVARTGLTGADDAPAERIDHAGDLQNKMRAPAPWENPQDEAESAVSRGE